MRRCASAKPTASSATAIAASIQSLFKQIGIGEQLDAVKLAAREAGEIARAFQCDASKCPALGLVISVNGPLQRRAGQESKFRAVRLFRRTYCDRRPDLRPDVVVELLARERRPGPGCRLVKIEGLKFVGLGRGDCDVGIGQAIRR